ncbi:MAG: hypothetical protein ACK5KR_08865 [Breznakia sp.]
MEKKYLNKYKNTYGKRYTRRQKEKFREAIRNDFDALGYESELHDANGRFARYKNIYVGNRKQAKLTIVVPYDTPSKVVWPKNKFYPQEGLVNMKKSFFPIYGPLLIGYGFFMLMIYVLPYVSNSPQVQSVIYLLSFVYFVFLLLFVARGFANKQNAQRNSASIALALAFAASLSKESRKQVMFIFTDGNRQTKYYGNKEVKKYREKHKISIPMLALSCLGKGNILRMIGDKDIHKTITKNLKKTYQGSLALQSKTVQDIDKGGTCLEHLKNIGLLSSGYMDNDGLYVLHTGTSKDNEIDAFILNDVKALMLVMLQKLK